MSRSKGISVGTEITGNAKGFKAAAEDAKKATEQLRQKGKQSSQDLDRAFKQIGIAMAAVTSAIATGRKAFDVYSNAMSTTSAAADKLSTQLDVVDAVVNTVYRSILRADFKTLAHDINRAIKAAQDFAFSEETATQRLSDLEVRKTAIRAKIYGLTNKQEAGTITPEEVQELKRLHEEVFTTEQDIYRRRIDAAVDFGIQKDGVDKSLFNFLQEGIIKRSYLSNQEVEEMSKIADKYEKERARFLLDNTISTYSPKFDKWIESVDMKGYTADLNRYISTLSDIERVQLFEDVYSTPQEFERLIGYMTTLNNLEQEHERYLKRINRGGKADKDEKIDRADPLPPIGSIMQTGRSNPVGLDPMRITYFKDQIVYSTQLVNELESSFRDLFAATGGGFDEMADAFISAIQRMATEALAKMAVFALLNLLTGGGGSLAGWAAQMLGGRNLSQFMGFTEASKFTHKAGGGALGGQNINLKVSGKLIGRDIFLSAQRYNETLQNNS